MKKMLMIPVAAMALTACATNQYGYGYDDPYRSDSRSDRVVKGAVVGAAAGAVLGAVVNGVSTTEGAVAGAAAGAVVGAVIKGKRYQRDTRGYCYYEDEYGNPVYDYDARC